MCLCNVKTKIDIKPVLSRKGSFIKLIQETTEFKQPSACISQQWHFNHHLTKTTLFLKDHMYPMTSKVKIKYTIWFYTPVSTGEYWLAYTYDELTSNAHRLMVSRISSLLKLFLHIHVTKAWPLLKKTCIENGSLVMSPPFFFFLIDDVMFPKSTNNPKDKATDWLLWYKQRSWNFISSWWQFTL